MKLAHEIVIEKASIDDAEEILALQKQAYLSEAEIIDDFTIPPLRQTIGEIRSEFDYQIFLKGTRNNKIIGSVRAFLKESTCYVGKLIVDPPHQNAGIGTSLLGAAEKEFPDAKRYELFTGQKSERNLYLYKKNGYKVFKREAVSAKLTLVFLEKINNSVY
jgi:GNAT superfamily N-acetyltransferase